MSGFILKAFVVSVDGFGPAKYYARSRAGALGKAFADYRSYEEVSFGHFLKMTRCNPDGFVGPRFGDQITICGKPAFFIDNNRQYVQFVRAGSDVILSAHPLEVKPIEYRPETYRSEKFDAQ